METGGGARGPFFHWDGVWIKAVYQFFWGGPFLGPINFFFLGAFIKKKKQQFFFFHIKGGESGKNKDFLLFPPPLVLPFFWFWGIFWVSVLG